uniref:Endonuclease/exonuclease/phosphatase domain-containing protein n=1 Tax=Iconisemion striatum TaxID=60296 RepID=A0A1A7XJA1_9TELE
MAPVLSACRLSAPVLFVFLLLLAHVFQPAHSRLVYDRHTLFGIGFSAGLLPSGVDKYQDTSSPPFLGGSAAFWQTSPSPHPTRRKRRRRGCRGGWLVKLRARRISFSGGPRAIWWSSSRFLVPWRLADPVGSWLVPVTGSSWECGDRSPPFWRLSRRGAVQLNLRPLARAPSVAGGSDSSLRWGLVNARSVANKTFILNDFIITQGLDILCVTESWILPGESSVFNELVPADCVFINVPRAARRGGGLAVICKANLRIKQLQPWFPNTSFELCLFELGHPQPLLCAVVYRPPRYNKDFLPEFSEFLANCASRYGQIMLLGDFNIHVCCPGKPLVSDFINLVNSFNFTQWVSEATQVCGHILDLVLSLGSLVSNLCLHDAVFSDHKPILFDNVVCGSVLKAATPVRLCRRVNSATSGQFSLLFNNAAPYLADWSSLDGLLSYFNGTCKDILDTIAPLRPKKGNHGVNLWSTDHTLAARRKCRRCERKWKKDILHVSLIALRESWKSYQELVKSAKTAYYSNLVSANANNSRVLYAAINSVLNVEDYSSVQASGSVCDSFLSFFVGKVEMLRAALPKVNVRSPSMPVEGRLVSFQPLSMAELVRLVEEAKPSGSPENILQSHH